MGLIALAGAATGDVARLAAAEPAGGLTINFFWIIVAAANFILFYALFQAFFAKPVAKMLSDRRAQIEQGLADAEAARLEREQSAELAETISQARDEEKEIIDRAQKVAQESRDADIAATREELERLRTQAAGDIEAEKQRALADLRAEVADLALAAAGRVVGETMSDDRQRRLVEQFIRETAEPGSGG